ncbi:properdin-like [Mixophyes fleayi]|uniref:properdin-like n=1 Tax=Mixophyes fleayi TaxID=3061075 RepID=UPI003F4E19F1
MSPLSLLVLCTAGILVTLQTATGSDDVLCFAEVNGVTGGCEDYLGDEVSELDCCLNINNGFKQTSQSPCEACRPAKWSQWSDWSPCTVSCREGVQKRQRVCLGQGDCEGNDVEVRSCSLQECCPAKGGWSQWSSWSQCSVTCEIGQRQRTRQCNDPPPVCGGSCDGNAIETESCDTRAVCPTHGSWGNWGLWRACSSGCIIEGSGVFPTQPRFRLCDSPPPSSSPPGKYCEGSNQEDQDCTTLPFCPLDGGWGAWQKESECSVTCGVGRVTQKRSCDSPAPRHGGRDCTGSTTRNTLCNTKVPCPINGEWTEWAEWSQCSRLKEEIKCTKRVGQQQRKRVCEGQAHDGEWCPGDYRQTRSCYEIDKCPLKGSWLEWSEWGLCSAPCGQSEKTRFRECLPKYPNYPDFVEGATKLVEVFFSGTPKVKCDLLNDKTTGKVEEQTECKNLPSCT